MPKGTLIAENIRPICGKCRKRPCRIKSRRRRVDGFISTYYGELCPTCHTKKYNIFTGYSYRRNYLDPRCLVCGYEPEHIIQLQLDHIDGNRKNNSPSNFQTLCANCHVLKTFVLSKDYLKNRNAEKVQSFLPYFRV